MPVSEYQGRDSHTCFRSSVLNPCRDLDGHDVTDEEVPISKEEVRPSFLCTDEGASTTPDVDASHSPALLARARESTGLPAEQGSKR